MTDKTRESQATDQRSIERPATDAYTDAHVSPHRAVPLVKPSGPMIYTVQSGANLWPSWSSIRRAVGLR